MDANARELKCLVRLECQGSASDSRLFASLRGSQSEQSREILLRHARPWVLQAQTVATAAEALQRLEMDSVDILILDWQLPDTDGFEFLARVRQSSNGKTASLIVLSATPLPASDPRLLPYQVSATLSKPIRRAQLLAALKRVANPNMSEEPAQAGRTFDPSLSFRFPMRILLADHHAVNQAVGARMLQGFGYRCEIAANGLEVLQALDRQPFDLVFPTFIHSLNTQLKQGVNENPQPIPNR